MLWIALSPSHEDERVAWGWWALRFTPRVAVLDEALVLEVSASERLWGGRRQLVTQLLSPPDLGAAHWAAGRTSPVALARLRLQLLPLPGGGREGGSPGRRVDALPLDLLTAARPHVPTLERIGCRTWGDLRALPRAGVSRRFGAPLLQALDTAYGALPEAHAWLTLPEQFDLKLELPALATSAPELMHAAQRLLTHLQLWLQMRNLGVLALELEWTLDLRRLDGKPLPPHERLELRTAQPTQDMAHLRRLASEHLARATISAPANHLRLRSLETVPWGGVTTSLLPDEVRQGEKLHQLIERLSARLGDGNVLVPQLQEDHRPERMQEWVPAKGQSALTPTLSRKRERESSSPLPSGERVRVRGRAARQPSAASPQEPIYPPWLLPTPLELPIRDGQIHYRGPLRRLTRLFRVETGWWEEGGPACRDYFIARGEAAGLVWIYRERPARGGQARWFLHGFYA